MRLELTGITTGGERVLLPLPLSLRFEADRDIPCDALNCVLPLPEPSPSLCEVTLRLEGETVFNGIVDRQTEEKSDRGSLLRLECRSKAALLLDNEVKPYIYFQLTSGQLYERYAAPCGIRGYQFPYETKKNFLQVKKGWSNWRVIEEYCRLVYGASPYVNREQVLLLEPVNRRQHILSNQLRVGLPYSSVSVQYRNDKLISRLYMKTATEAYGYYYGVVIDNPNAQSRRVRRERYYHPDNAVPIYAKSETQRIIDESNRESFRVTVALPGFCPVDIGDRVAMPDEDLPPLIVSGVSLRMDGSGILTRMTLIDGRYAETA